MKLVSVIIPVYNGEKYLGNAIESCISQIYNKLEIIIINDGSTDETQRISEEYAKHDKRITVYNTNNGGSAYARNIGLKKSNGEYIQFLDSDDTLEPNAIEIAVNELEEIPEADFLIYGLNIYKNGEILRQPNPGRVIYRPGDGYQQFKKIHRLIVSPCNKLYKRKYITVPFDEKRVFAEDHIFNYKNFKKNTTIKTVENCLYNVNLETENSVNKRYKKGKLADFIFSREIEEETLINIFSNDFNNENYKVTALSSMSYIICGMANCLTVKEIQEELNSALISPYCKELLNHTAHIKIYNRVLFSLIKKHNYKILKTYAKLMLILYSIING